MSDNWDDNWEISDLIVKLHETIKSKEGELRLLEDRKMMEDSEFELVENLFDKKSKVLVKELVLLEPVKLNKKEKSKVLQDKERQEQKKRQEHKERREQSQKEKKHMELFGEAEIDEYDTLYGYIEEKY